MSGEAERSSLEAPPVRRGETKWTVCSEGCSRWWPEGGRAGRGPRAVGGPGEASVTSEQREEHSRQREHGAKALGWEGPWCSGARRGAAHGVAGGAHRGFCEGAARSGLTRAGAIPLAGAGGPLAARLGGDVTRFGNDFEGRTSGICWRLGVGGSQDGTVPLCASVSPSVQGCDCVAQGTWRTASGLSKR